MSWFVKLSTLNRKQCVRGSRRSKAKWNRMDNGRANTQCLWIRRCSCRRWFGLPWDYTGAKACLRRTVTWSKVLTSSKPLPGLCVAISKNMILKITFRWWWFSFLQWGSPRAEPGSKTIEREASDTALQKQKIKIRIKMQGCVLFWFCSVSRNLYRLHHTRGIFIFANTELDSDN